MKTTSAEHEQNMFCACSFHANSMKNLLSYCGLIDAKIRASGKDLPVPTSWNSSQLSTWADNCHIWFDLDLTTTILKTSLLLCYFRKLSVQIYKFYHALFTCFCFFESCVSQQTFSGFILFLRNKTPAILQIYYVECFQFDFVKCTYVFLNSIRHCLRDFLFLWVMH